MCFTVWTVLQLIYIGHQEPIKVVGQWLEVNHYLIKYLNEGQPAPNPTMKFMAVSCSAIQSSFTHRRAGSACPHRAFGIRLL